MCVCFQIVEPLLKYKRIQNDLTAILAKDAASCLAVHTKVRFMGPVYDSATRLIH